MSGICKILAVTSGRADASPMRPVIEALRERGVKVRECDLAGMDVWEACQEGYWKASVCARTDLMLVLGDRYEILAAALAATVAKIPIAHIHGGEASFGSFDNQIRDAVTKLSHIHFVANNDAWTRVQVGLGEDQSRIHVVGAPGLDNIAPILEEERKPGKYFVVTWHPETLGDDAGFDAMCLALKQFPEYEVRFTTPNNDPGSEFINYGREKHGFGCYLYSPTHYLRAVYNCAAVIGNSSSGIIEAPTLGVPTVNIGMRQDGRMKAASVFDGGSDTQSIIVAINCALYFDRDKPMLARPVKLTPGTINTFDPHPYGTPGASAKIADVLAEIDLDGVMVKKW